MKKSFLLRSSVLAAVLSATASALAGFYAYDGSTVGGPTFNRPLEDGTALSVVGTAVNYSALTFTISVDGNYLFGSSRVNPPDYDNFILLYSSFDPTAPLTGYLAGNDDFNSTPGLSSFSAALTAGTYTFVTTGFDNGDFGTFSNSILGPGPINPVPEPASMTALGLGALAIMRRRKKA